MSGTSTPQHEHDEALLSIGAQCSHPTCSLVDFLPFKCQHCTHLFCQNHFKVRPDSDRTGDGHACAHYDETKANRVVPSCPLCSVPVAIPPGEDPNVRMDRHIAAECTVTTGRNARSRLPHCARAKCGKVLYAPIACAACRQQFCPAHRFPADHTCAAPAPSLNAQQQIAQAGARGAAAMAAVKRSLASAPLSSASKSAAAKPRPAAPASKASAPQEKEKTTYNPFNAADRRAKAERDSRRKALQERAKRGVLSERDKVELARMEGERGEGDKDGECAIM